MKKSRTSAPERAGDLTRRAWRPWALGVLLVAVTAAAYSNSFRGPFIFDDLDSISDNESIRSLWPLSPVLFPPAAGGRTASGRPLVNLSLAVNYALHGTDVWGYHALNLAVHILAGLTLWGILRRTLRLAIVPKRFRDAGDWLATVATLLWAVHPLTTSAVTYIIQRAESIMALFYLLTLYCVIRAAGSPRRAIWSVSAVIAAALGMASKEVMATAPLIVLLYDRTFLAGSFGQALCRRWGLYAGLAATWVIPAALLGGRAESAGFGGAISVGAYALTQFEFVARYLRLSLWPHPLVLDYGKYLASGIGAVLPQAVLVTGLVIATGMALRYRPAWGFLGVWVFLILAPSSSIIPVITQTGAEHRMYLPLVAVVVTVVLGGYWLWQQWVVPALPRANSRRWIGGLIVVGVAGLLASLTHQRNRDYQSGVSIWADAAAKRPSNARAHYNLGRHLVDVGELATAKEQFLLTVQQEPDYSDAHVALGCIRARLGQPAEAIADFDRAIQAAPREANGYFNRAVVHFSQGRFEATIDDCNAAIARNANYASAYYERGLAQQKLMRTEPAIASYTEAIRLRPGYTAAFGERAISYCFLQQYDDAWADVRMFRRLGGSPNPKFIERLSHASGRTE